MARAAPGLTQERQSRLMIIAAIAFAAIAAVLVFAALRSGDDDGGGGAAATTDVVVASQNIDANERITADMLEIRAIADDQVLSGAYTDVATVVDLPARYPIQAGQQVTSASIGVSQIEDEKDIALVIPDGRRAFAIDVTEVTSVGGLLLPGNFVDILAVFAKDFENEELAAALGLTDIADLGRAITVFQNIEVLGVAQEAQEPVPAASDEGTTGSGIDGQRPDDVERQPSARSVTLSVTPQQAQVLALFMALDGTIFLSMRGTGDDATAPVTPADLRPFFQR